MGKQPAVLIIARHGTRLDQAKKEWHETASQPWDSPLSYGGWIQSQSLGVRIATELNNLDIGSTATSGDGQGKDTAAPGPRPRKRRRVIIHSSPYLRCIQTSIGVAAGLRNPQDVPRMRPVPTPFQRSSLSKPPMLVDDTTASPDNIASSAQPSANRTEPELTGLKIDAWLGEWLSSGYFSKTQAPPSSDELVRGAKEFLKKPPEEIKGADLSSSIQEFEESNWGDKMNYANEVKSAPIQEKTGLRAMAAKGYSTPRRTRTISLTTNRDINSVTGTSEPIGRRPRSSTYSPPVPTYSISPQDPIPIGFVAHARDSCIDADFDWDSQQPPLSWGDGGEYEEEWSTMHRRFRIGLQSMLGYYDTDDVDAMDTDDSDEDLILILVTHQAGCNALIRLVTGAPALHDVGTASLTLAVRKAGLTRVKSAQGSNSPTRRRGSVDLGFDDDFDMKIIASIEHLRSGSNPLGLNSPRLAMSPAFASRRMVGAESLEGFSIGDPLSWRSSSSTNLPRRDTGGRGHASSLSTGSDSIGGTGLWSIRHTRTSSASSDVSVDPRTVPGSTPKSSSTNISGSAIAEDSITEDWASNPINPHVDAIVAPVQLDGQSTWQPAERQIRPPVRKGSTVLTGNVTAGTGLWGSPVINSGGVKEGTPYSRSSFGMADAPTPMWGPRSSSQRLSSNMAKMGFGATKEEEDGEE